MQAFSSAIATGSLGPCTTIDLAKNKIGDLGMQALATAVSSGSMGSLVELSLFGNRIGDEKINIGKSAWPCPHAPGHDHALVMPEA